MAATGGGHVYATLLLSDSYLLGALVLAHSLRDAGTTKQLAVLVTLDSVSADSITQLKTVYDHVFPVPRIRNERPANLYLMNRADLHSAFTKINLWKQTQFSKIVYIDADVVAYRAPDELFDLRHAFSAAPDIGWPDLFNTGVMTLTPNMGDYYALMAMAERGISFDGADQGLLNMHFKNDYHRLSFTYNVTPSAHYQYLPAYRHFQSSISMVHFIGSEKPWFSGRHAPHGNSPYDEMVGKWWAVYDRHYRAQETAPQHTSEYVQYFTKGEFQPREEPQQPSTGEQHHQDHPGPVHGDHHDHSFYPASASGHEKHQHHHHHHDHDSHAGDSATHVTHSVGLAPETLAEARSEQQVPEPPSGGAPTEEPRHEPRSITMHSWDAQRQPPPSDSKPEAMNFPATHYEMSQDVAPFVPPERYPSPPKGMWYEVPQETPASRAHRPRPIFPWENHQPRPSRSFTGDMPEETKTGESSTEPPGERQAAIAAGASTEVSATGSTTTEAKSEPSTPTTPSIRVIPSNPWTSFPRVNAWDDVPEIGRYVDGLQKHRRGKSQGSLGGSGGVLSPGEAPAGAPDSGRVRGFKLTDFPSEAERPSLPVTPAPIHRASFWGDDDASGSGHDEGQQPLPVAEGVPAQSEWDPTEQLQKLAKQQSEALLRRLGGEQGGSSGVSRDIPLRPLPFGSEASRSPTHLDQSAPLQPMLSPQPVKGGDDAGASVLRGMSAEGEPTAIAEPSYAGPSTAWERGEDVPLQETPLPPTEEERDVLS